jgi:hypothetical protein
MISPLSTSALLALVQLSTARLVTSSSSTVLLPPISTGESNEDIWASVLDEHDSTIEYLLACPAAFSASPARPEDCQGPYAGAILTYGPSPSGVTKVTLAGVEYEYTRNDGAISYQTSEDGFGESVEISGDESKEWIQTITVVSVVEATEVEEPSSTATFGAYLEDELNTELRVRKSGSGRGKGGSSSGSTNDNNTDEDDDDSAASKTTGLGLAAVTALFLTALFTAAAF